jgi:hypothetical protein
MGMNDMNDMTLASDVFLTGPTLLSLEPPATLSSIPTQLNLNSTPVPSPISFFILFPLHLLLPSFLSPLHLPNHPPSRAHA